MTIPQVLFSFVKTSLLSITESSNLSYTIRSYDKGGARDYDRQLNEKDWCASFTSSEFFSVRNDLGGGVIVSFGGNMYSGI